MDKPKVTKATLTKKIFQGIYSNDWKVIGVGGTQEKMVQPLVQYLISKGIEVK